MERATLNGTIRDPGGLAVSGAKVELLSSSTGAKREALTGDTGTYLIAQVPNGEYTVTITMEGFKTAKLEAVRLSVGERRTLDLTLEVGTVSTQVEVVAGATPVDESTSEIGTAVGEAQLKQIPIKGRNWTALMLLAPGATNTGEGNQNSIRFFGRPRDENNWNFDGVDATGVKDPRQEGNLRLVISLDSIADNAGSGEGQELMIVSCRRCDRGPADFDIRQTFTANSIYDLPWGRNKLWGGWSLSGFFFARTGRAVNITVVRAVGVLPDGNNTPPQRPDYIARQALYPSTQIPDSYLNRGAYAIPAANTWGNLGRNAARGPGLWQLDSAVTKRNRITERVNLEFRTEAFNLFNRAQFGNPASNISNANFGSIQTTANDGATGAGTSRQLQFALRLNF
jgi:hypothetical protein